MIIRCTQKLLAELKIRPTQEESASDPFWGWHAKLFHIERRKCVLITNDTTLFTIFIPALKKPDFASFQLVIGQHLFKNLLRENIPQRQIESVLSECENMKFQKTDNRSVLGSMNDQKLQLEYLIFAEGGLARTDIYELNQNLNRNILSAISYKHPIKMLKQKLKEIT
jgi:2-polyprenyl-6-methoxyphenol hydroxylase-like FAD-dependent oxidoreductase